MDEKVFIKSRLELKKLSNKLNIVCNVNPDLQFSVKNRFLFLISNAAKMTLRKITHSVCVSFNIERTHVISNKFPHRVSVLWFFPLTCGQYLPRGRYA